MVYLRLGRNTRKKTEEKTKPKTTEQKGLHSSNKQELSQDPLILVPEQAQPKGSRMIEGKTRWEQWNKIKKEAGEATVVLWGIENVPNVEQVYLVPENAFLMMVKGPNSNLSKKVLCALQEREKDGLIWECMETQSERSSAADALLMWYIGVFSAKPEVDWVWVVSRDRLFEVLEDRSLDFNSKATIVHCSGIEHLGMSQEQLPWQEDLWIALLKELKKPSTEKELLLWLQEQLVKPYEMQTQMSGAEYQAFFLGMKPLAQKTYQRWVEMQAVFVNPNKSGEKNQVLLYCQKPYPLSPNTVKNPNQTLQAPMRLDLPKIQALEHLSNQQRKELLDNLVKTTQAPTDIQKMVEVAKLAASGLTWNKIGQLQQVNPNSVLRLVKIFMQQLQLDWEGAVACRSKLGLLFQQEDWDWLEKMINDPEKIEKHRAKLVSKTSSNSQKKELTC